MHFFSLTVDFFSVPVFQAFARLLGFRFLPSAVCAEGYCHYTVLPVRLYTLQPTIQNDSVLETPVGLTVITDVFLVGLMVPAYTNTCVSVKISLRTDASKC